MEFLKNNGVSFGEEGIIPTTGHHKSWYVSETEENNFLLRKYRAEHISIAKNNTQKRRFGKNG